MYNGLNSNMENLFLLSNAKSRSISAENKNGEKGGAVRAVPGSDSPSSELGTGWKVSPCITLKVNETAILADIEGPGAIQSMWFGGNITPDFIIRIYWDEQENASVEAPLNAFFGYGFENAVVNHWDGKFPVLNSLPVVVAPHRGLSCFWTMPFKKHCKITLENRGSVDHYTFFQINYVLTEVPEDIAYYHASYRQALPVENGLYTIIDGICGKGQYVGTALFSNLNNDVDCWVEGEVMVYLDGDTEFPSIAYTGTEDYFGGSYNFGREGNGRYNTYSTPYFGMYYVYDTKTAGDVDCDKFLAYRWHIADPIRFDSDIKVVMQNIRYRNHKFVFRSDDYASMAYWYQTLPTAPFKPLPSAKECALLGRDKRV